MKTSTRELKVHAVQRTPKEYPLHWRAAVMASALFSGIPLCRIDCLLRIVSTLAEMNLMFLMDKPSARGIRSFISTYYGGKRKISVPFGIKINTAKQSFILGTLVNLTDILLN